MELIRTSLISAEASGAIFRVEKSGTFSALLVLIAQGLSLALLSFDSELLLADMLVQLIPGTYPR